MTVIAGVSAIVPIAGAERRCTPRGDSRNSIHFLVGVDAPQPLLFGKGARHLTAEMLYEEATLAKVPVSLATVYNTLNQLTDAGLLRQVSVDGTKTYFDTNVTTHHHFYLENNHELVDIPDPHLMLNKMPEVPDGYEIARVDMVVRLRKKR